MSIRLKIPKGIYVELNEIKEQLIADLDEHKLRYTVLFDSVTDTGLKETLISIPDAKVEVLVNNDIIKYIKADSSIYTKLDEMENITDDVISHINTVKERVKERFNHKMEFMIENIDTKSMNITFIVNEKGSTEKARMRVVRDTFGDIYINTLKAL